MSSQSHHNCRLNSKRSSILAIGSQNPLNKETSGWLIPASEVAGHHIYLMASARTITSERDSAPKVASDLGDLI